MEYVVATAEGGSRSFYDVYLASDFISRELGWNIDEYDRLIQIFGNMKHDEMFRTKEFVVMCFENEV